MIIKVYIARDLDGRLYQYPYWENMGAMSIPHRHVNGYPFDRNYYIEGNDYLPHKGEEIPSNLYSEIIYDNSPVLIELTK